MEDSINAAHNNREVVHVAYCQLSRLASAAYQMGNERLADKLLRIADTIDASAETVTRAVAKDLVRNIHRADEATFNMVTGMVAVLAAPDPQES